MRWLVALCLVVSSVCTARPYRLEDMLRLESYGQVLIAARAKLVLVERRAPYDTASDFSYGFLVRRLLSRIEVADLTSPTRLRPLFEQPAGAGYWMGGLSPDGRHLSVFRLKERRLSLGVVDLRSRQVRWLPGTPDLPLMSPAPIWLDSTHLAVVMIDDGSLPFILSLGNAIQIDLERLWAWAARGRASSATSATTDRASPISFPRSLVEIDARTGTVRTLWRGEIVDVAPSADRRRFAIVAAAGLRPPPVTPIDTSFIGRTHRIVLVDRVTDRTVAVDGDYLPGFLRWSPDAPDLLAFRAGTGFTDGQFVRITASGKVDVLAPSLRAIVSTEQSGTTVRAGWGGTMIVAAMEQDGKRTWMRIDGAPRTLSLSRTAELTNSATDGLWFLDQGMLFRVDRHGHRKASERNVVQVGIEHLDPFSVGYRHTVDPDGPVPVVVRQGEHASVAPLPGTRHIKTAPSSVILDAHGDAVVTLDADAHGTATLRLRRAGSSVILDTINPHLANIDAGQAIPLHRGSASPAPVDWLFLPERLGRVPMIVIPYPGAIFTSQRPVSADPSAWSVPTNVNMLLAHGYAVLLPSIPAAPAGSPAAGLVDAVNAAADAAIATGRIDGARLGILGHSFGAYAAMTIATRTARFRAVVASSGPYDLVSAHAMMGGSDRIRLSRGLPFENAAGWTEAGQARMGATPSAAPNAYVANSPIYDAARVHVPVMLVHGDMDTVALEQAEHMFMELGRHRADATLIRYWGEGHVLASPANIRDYWHRVIAFFDDHLAVTRPRLSPKPRSSPEWPVPDNRD